VSGYVVSISTNAFVSEFNSYDGRDDDAVQISVQILEDRDAVLLAEHEEDRLLGVERGEVENVFSQIWRGLS
jgi:hypothetical protein